ncbi:zinc metallopeptidase [Gordonibacter massiliensis (ex Traore et al. 2017)]|uniref:zinc metallopeptidase n=1 Tax=Gordonibacter massiliensis (ex Traore et al. 2017) TaxID=1841863 RepID=UPI001C8CD18D|nr:zinc metallopeptidase [Gordonibacter massiliensis (ex Traore et al. 2017)]MBX9033143.1 zinc metallopeptidase [Gordonibacter massiliensis (ex Traore et al. 2017)]
MFFGLSNGYLLLIVVTLIIGGFATWYVNSQLKKYTRVPISNGLTGAEAARRMLAYYGVTNVAVNRGGAGQDFFDPRTNSVTLSPDAFDGRSITATATACHEVGHACQYAQDYAPMKIRGAIVPVVNLASNAWIFLLMIGIFANITQLTTLAIVMYAVVVLFQLVTLPVEFNASRRAMTYMDTIALPQSEQSGAFNVLRACALTYVAAALTSILQLLWLLDQRRD